MTQHDKGNYLRGLLIIIGRDRIVKETEKKAVMQVGKALGFEERFCETAIGEILENEYIIAQPPLFSNKEIAEYFIKDGIKIAGIDNDLHLLEIKWLALTAEVNNLSDNFNPQIIKYCKSVKNNPTAEFEPEIYNYLMNNNQNKNKKAVLS